LDNLAREGLGPGARLVGDVMYDAVLYNAGLAEGQATILDRLALEPGGFALATVHRPRNTDDLDRLRSIVTAFDAMPVPVVFPVHPRTRRRLEDTGLEAVLAQAGNLLLIEPVGYLDMLVLEKNAQLILTDSGGVQKEAYFFAVPCLTLREETEWVETVEAGWNLLVGADREAILEAASAFRPVGVPPNSFGDGHAASRIAELLLGDRPAANNLHSR
jgi:UDP-N-acetylglucosamine 2-epimerase